jgi:hypothetical protein
MKGKFEKDFTAHNISGKEKDNTPGNNLGCAYSSLVE